MKFFKKSLIFEIIKNIISPPNTFFPKSKIPILYQTIFIVIVFFILYNLILISSMPFLLIITNNLTLTEPLKVRLIEIIVFLLSGFTISIFINNKKSAFKICLYVWFMIMLINSIFYIFLKESIILNSIIKEINTEEFNFLDFFDPIIFMTLGVYIKFILLNNTMNCESIPP